MTKLFLVALLIINISLITSFPIYESQDSNVVNLNPKNFDTQITQTRAKNTISFIHFYKPNDLKSNLLKAELNKVALDYDGMFKIAAVNCDDHPTICAKQEVKEYPSFKMYPPLPAPVFPFEHEVVAKNIVWALGNFLENKSVEVHGNNHDNFIGENANLPKIFLFTDKKNTPLLFKALSIAFDKKLKFGIIRKEETALTSKYRIKKYPTIMVVPVGTNQKNQYYQGETKYKPLFDFVNVFSETFFKVGEDKVKASDVTKEDKPWLNEKLPQLDAKSGNEVCFKVDGILCIVLMINEKPNEEMINLMSTLQNFLAPKISRGLKYKFGWMNHTLQTEFSKQLNIENYPRLIIVNPGKRKRFFAVEGELNMDNFVNVFDKLASGDLRFRPFSGNKFADLVESEE